MSKVESLKTYRCWVNMKNRCDNPRNPSFKNYGGRGIRYVKSWVAYDCFLKDMGESPIGKSLDRKDNSRGYSKRNCRWASYKEQNRNNRHNTIVRGKTLSEWCEVLNLKRNTLCMRIYVYKWPLDRALSEPVNK